MIRAASLAVAAALAALTLAACGQKGPLKLPDSAKAEPDKSGTAQPAPDKP